MEIIFSDRAKGDLKFWKESGDVAILKTIRKLLESIQQTPFDGIGHPEPLKYQLTGLWSRRISHEHRMVYKVENDKITVIQLRVHY